MNFKLINHKNFADVLAIYKEGLETNIATFQEDLPTWEAWDIGHLQCCRISICKEDEMLGWAALSPVSSRNVYAGVAEVSVYIKASERGKGLGEILLNELINQSEINGLWLLQSSIFSENDHSINLHKKCGFRLVGYREKIAKKNGFWKDTVLMERRSSLVL